MDMSPDLELIAEHRGTARMKPPLIVLIDDDMVWAEAMKQLLEEEGYQVRTAADGDRGCALLEETEPQLVILDMGLPKVDGLGVLREARRLGLRAPILMVSAEDHSNLVGQAMGEGAAAFLRKPVAAALLLRAVRRLLSA
jgi:DNA-binding response OmpR family regulator